MPDPRRVIPVLVALAVLAVPGTMPLAADEPPAEDDRTAVTTEAAAEAETPADGEAQADPAAPAEAGTAAEAQTPADTDRLPTIVIRPSSGRPSAGSATPPARPGTWHAPSGRRWVGSPISLSLRDADLVEVLRSIARLADVNLVIQPGVSGSVTLELKDVPWDQALHVILKTHGLGAELDGTVLSIGH